MKEKGINAERKAWIFYEQNPIIWMIVSMDVKAMLTNSNSYDTQEVQYTTISESFKGRYKLEVIQLKSLCANGVTFQSGKIDPWTPSRGTGSM